MKNMTNKTDNIVASLKWGELYYKKFRAIYFVTLFFVAVGIGCVIALIVMTFTGQENNLELTIWLMVTSFLCVPATWFLIFAMKVNKKKRLKGAIDDLVYLTAYSKSIKTVFGNSKIFLNKALIEVTFEYEGKEYVRRSGATSRWQHDDGFHNIFVKYMDREINIAYSPKTDEVFIMKD